MLLLPGIQYSTGQYLPIEEIAKEAKKHVSTAYKNNVEYQYNHNTGYRRWI